MSKEQFFKLLAWMLEDDDWIEPIGVKNTLDRIIGFSDEQRAWAEEWQEQAEKEASDGE